jgi:hypothetical protein
MKTSISVALTLLAAIGTNAASAGGQRPSKGQTGPNGEPYVPGKWFDRFFMIIGENMDIWDVEAQPTFANLWKQAPNGRILANYYGVVHPSQAS